MEFINIILNLIEQTGTTKNKVTADLGLGKNSFVDWKKNGNIPKGETLSKLANYFDVSIPYLLGKTKNPTTTNDSEANLQDPINAEILEKFDRLSPQFRKIALDYLENLAKHQDS